MSKRPGDIAEIKFHLAAHERDLVLAKPLRDTQYDFLLDTGTRIVRIQVKSTNCKVDDSYRLDVRYRSGTKKYTPDQVDFIVGYVHDFDAWYIVPIADVKAANLALYPHKSQSRGALEKFRDAWNLLV